ncbi:MAG: DUF192 domain-containing protein [Alphaproteobacteria bacterium]|jgi:hypothetical protein|nr:DUF192 domain-containing protein [Alphaproteobacteria bacterium]
MRHLLVAMLLLLAPPAAAEDMVFPRGELWIESAGTRHHFEIEVLENERQMARGLMFRKELADNAGMLFDFGRTGPIAMWMKNTLIPLDMLFVDEHGTITRIARWTTPLSLETISSGGPARAVVEIKGGRAEQLGIVPGDTVIHPIFVP